jgi:hypothetical protein
MAQVLQQPFQSHETPHIATLLPRQRDVSHLSLAELERFSGGHAGPVMLGQLELPVKLELLRQLIVELSATPAED